MRVWAIAAIWVLTQVSLAAASAPDRSIRPLPRGVSIQPATSTQPTTTTRTVETKRERKGLFGFLKRNNTQRPEKRPTGLSKQSAARIAKGAQGSVCGISTIRGAAIKPIRGSGSCGVANAVKITSVDGVALTQYPTIDCVTAKALHSWVRNGVKPAVGKRGGGVKSLKVVAHYACRTRNNRKGAKLSEHAKGRAVDIAAINLNNGEALTVLKGWRSKSQGPVLRQMHKAACGPFGTVLGPNADRYHQDHFHFDTARYRSGSYCR